MPLNLPTTGSDFTPFIKFNAKAGRFYIRVDDQDQEVVNPTLVIDMPNIKTGWINFLMSGPPLTAWNVTTPPTDEKGWKQGFRVAVCGEPPIGEREWMSNSINCNAAMVKMYDAWEARPEHTDPAKVPWYRFVRVEGIHGQYGTNYEPVFELAGFTERAGRFSDTVQAALVVPPPVPQAGMPQPHPTPQTLPQEPLGPTPPPVQTAPSTAAELDDEIGF